MGSPFVSMTSPVTGSWLGFQYQAWVASYWPGLKSNWTADAYPPRFKLHVACLELCWWGGHYWGPQSLQLCRTTDSFLSVACIASFRLKRTTLQRGSFQVSSSPFLQVLCLMCVMYVAMGSYLGDNQKETSIACFGGMYLDFPCLTLWPLFFCQSIALEGRTVIKYDITFIKHVHGGVPIYSHVVYMHFN